MEITRENLENRMGELVVARAKVQGDLNAHNGAIQFCQQLLDVMGQEPDAPPHPDRKLPTVAELAQKTEAELAEALHESKPGPGNSGGKEKAA